MTSTTKQMRSNGRGAHVLNAPAEGLRLKFCNGAGDQKTRMMSLPDSKKCDDISIR